MRQTAIALARCPCREPLGCATHEGECAPSPGDISLCFACARPFLFDSKLQPQPTTLDALSSEGRQQVERKQAQIRWFRSFCPPKVRS